LAEEAIHLEYGCEIPMKGFCLTLSELPDLMISKLQIVGGDVVAIWPTQKSSNIHFRCTRNIEPVTLPH
jgi:hypothetical protein